MKRAASWFGPRTLSSHSNKHAPCYSTKEIAALFKVKIRTVHWWLSEKKFPEPDLCSGIIHKSLFWHQDVIQALLKDWKEK